MKRVALGAVLAIVAVSLVVPSSWAQTASAVERARSALGTIDLAACPMDEVPSTTTFRLALVVFPDGTWASTASSSSAPTSTLDALRACLAHDLASRLHGALPRAPRTAAVVTRTWRPARLPAPSFVVEPVSADPAEAHDGSRGAICQWGQRRGDFLRLPRPATCRAGLTCCAGGGAAGSDSTCVRAPAGVCPAYP